MVPALFSNQRETNLQSTVALVEAVLGELGHPASGARIDDKSGERPTRSAAAGEAEVSDKTALHAWRFQQGSAAIAVALVHRTAFTHIRVSAVVMTLDAKVDRAALFAHLLTRNAELTGAAFALDNDRVLLVSERSTLDLDRSEVTDLIRRVAQYADDHDDLLVERFGGTLGAT